MNNRLHNSSNPNQGKNKRVLCVCSAGLLRSPTAANVLHNEYSYNTRSCGIALDYALIPMDEVLVAWADEIVFMELAHLKVAEQLFPEIKEKNTIVLGISDNHSWNSANLKKLIIKQYSIPLEHMKED